MMVIGIAAIVLALIVKAGWRSDREVLLVLSASFAYYCCAGPWYWIGQDGAFAGVVWGRDAVLRSAQVLAGSTVLLAGALLASSQLFARRHPLATGTASLPLPLPPIAKLALAAAVAAGGIASLFVLSQSSFADDTYFQARSPVFLIAYQFSDLLIPVILFLVATKGYRRGTLLLLAYFTFYAILVGFRYKLALLFLPIMMERLASAGSTRKKIIWSGSIGAAVLTLFALMTLYRSKFGVPDLTRQVSDPIADLTYGFFAESNTIIGLNSVLLNYLDAGRTYPVDPFLDVIKEWVPRALAPNRVTGAYLEPMRLGLLTKSGMQSGTAHPWIGEFIMAFGYPAFVLGPALMALLYAGLKRSLIRRANDARRYTIGIACLAAMLGYYHYSRGYLPQVAKGYLFVVIPYIVLCGLTFRRRPASTSSQPIRQSEVRFRSEQIRALRRETDQFRLPPSGPSEPAGVRQPPNGGLDGTNG